MLGAQAPNGRGRWETFAIQASAACITRIPTHKLASHMRTFFFSPLSLFAAGLFDLRVPGLFAVVSILP